MSRFVLFHHPKKLAYRASVLFFAALMALTNTSPTLAAVNMDFMAQVNAIWYTGTSGVACATSTGTGGPLVGENRVEQAYNFFISAGLKPEVSAGVVGNMQGESGVNLDPTIENSIGAYGIAQWLYGRKTALIAKIQEKVPNYASFTTHGNAGGNPSGEEVSQIFEVQLNFLVEELKTRPITGNMRYSSFYAAVQGKTEWEALQSVSDRNQAVEIMLRNFEVPCIGASCASHIGPRYKYAEEISNKYGNGSTTSTGSTAQNASCTTTGNGDASALQNLALQWAWPDKRQTLQKKPEYATAISKAVAEGGFAGDPNNPGVDCGGFVTRLVVDSGYDTGYNHNGKNANGAGPTTTQEAWAKANWEELGGPGASKNQTMDASQLQPGDVAFVNGHTFIYVGQLEGFDSNIAEASIHDFAPQAGVSSLFQASRGGTRWYRKKDKVASV